jgi:hypothetical protein
MAFHVMDVTGWAPLGGCHWLDGRIELAKEHVCYVVNKTWHSPPSLAVGPGLTKKPLKSQNNTIKVASF